MRSLWKIGVMALLWTGCGPGPWAITTCHPLCMGEVRSEFEIDCKEVQSNVFLADQLLSSRGLIREDLVCHAYDSVRVRIQELDQWDGSIMGKYDFMGPQGNPQIFLNQHGYSLVHEMLHHWQFVNGQYDTFLHHEWDTNGYDCAASAYIALGIDYTTHTNNPNWWGNCP